jgi:hypothetical protein
MLARTLACTICATVALVACDAGVGPPRATPPSPPAGGNDPDFAISGVDGWHLIGNALTPGHDSLTLAVAGPGDTAAIDVWIDDGAGQRLAAGGDGRFDGVVAIGDLGPGEHQLLFAADGATTAFARATFFRTHPMYFVVSTDWDFAEPGQAALDAHDRLRAAHPDIRFTQFVGPYTYTDPVVSEARKAEITTWLTSRRDQHDDEIARCTSTRGATSSPLPASRASPISRPYRPTPADTRSRCRPMARPAWRCAARRRRPDLRRARPGQAGHVPGRRLDGLARDAQGARGQGLRRRHQRAQLGAHGGVESTAQRTLQLEHGDVVDDQRHQPAVLPQRR